MTAESKSKAKVAKGPRGGTTTVTKSGLVKKNLWLHRDDAEALRQKAYAEGKTEAEIIRAGLSKVLKRRFPATKSKPIARRPEQE